MLVKDVKDLASTIKKAFHIAATGRPGPVVVDIPKDVTTATCEFAYPESVSMRSYNPVKKGHAGQIKKAVQLLLEAERPMVYSGGGVVLANASAELRELMKLTGFPITNTLMGLGAYPATDKQFLGMLGMHGTYEANMAMQHCDVLLAIGARFRASTTGSSATRRTSRRTRARSSTSISTRRRSPSASRSTCRSSATSPTSSRRR